MIAHSCSCGLFLPPVRLVGSVIDAFQCVF